MKSKRNFSSNQNSDAIEAVLRLTCSMKPNQLAKVEYANTITCLIHNQGKFRYKMLVGI